jgi:hypothetical protein
MKSFPRFWVIGFVLSCLLLTTGFSLKGQIIQTVQAGPTIFLPVIYGMPIPLNPVEVLSNTMAFEDSSGSLHILGEVSNHTQASLRSIQIPFDLYDTNGQVIASGEASPILTSLPVNDRTCFEAILPLPASLAYYRFGTPTYLTGAPLLLNLSLLQPVGAYDPNFGSYDVTGQIRNDSSVTVRYISPVGTLYNAAGAVIGCDYTYVVTYTLGPGTTSAFSLSFASRDYSDADHFRLQIDGEIP